MQLTNIVLIYQQSFWIKQQAQTTSENIELNYNGYITNQNDKQVSETYEYINYSLGDIFLV